MCCTLNLISKQFVNNKQKKTDRFLHTMVVQKTKRHIWKERLIRFEKFSATEIMGTFVKRIRKSDGKVFDFPSTCRGTMRTYCDSRNRRLDKRGKRPPFLALADCSFAVDRAYNSQAGGISDGENEEKENRVAFERSWLFLAKE